MSTKPLAIVALALFACPKDQVAPAPAKPPELIDITPTDLLAKVRASPAKVVILNVWATWCAPCVEELPDFLRLHRAYRDKGVELMLLSGDFQADRAAAQTFLAGLGVDFTTYRKNATDMELIDALSKDWSGALPATFIFAKDEDAASRSRRPPVLLEGQVTYTALEREVLRVLGGGA